MTDTDIRVDDLTDIGTGALHIACCLTNAFYCHAPYHPEAEATEEHDEDDCCKRCVDLRYELMCPPQRPNHQHCPFTKQICPRR